MKFRKNVNKSRDQKIFTNTAQKSKAINYRLNPMRGGYRL